MISTLNANRKRKGVDVAQPSSSNNKDIDMKITDETNQHVPFSSFFDLNQFAFSVWSYFCFYDLIGFSSVHSSWKNRIWPFRDDSTMERTQQENSSSKRIKKIKRKGKTKMKVDEIQSAVENQHFNSTITSSNTHYVYHLKSLQLQNLFPPPSRAIALFLLAKNLQALSLHETGLVSKPTIGIQNIRLLSKWCKQLKTLNFKSCLVTASMVYPLREMKSLEKLSIFDIHWLNRGKDSLDAKDILHLQSSLPNLKDFTFCSIYIWGTFQYLNHFLSPQTSKFKFWSQTDLYIGALQIGGPVVFNRLTHLTFGAWERGNWASFSKWFTPEAFPSLVSFNCITQEIDAKKLEAFARFKNLQHLGFGGHVGFFCRLSHSAEVHFDVLRGLTSLTSFTACKFDGMDDLISRMCSINLLSKLKRLILFECTSLWSRDKSIMRILEPALAGSNELEELKVYNTCFSERSFELKDMAKQSKLFRRFPKMFDGRINNEEEFMWELDQ
jgi:hypothetical protein